MTSKVETVELPGVGVRRVFATNSGIEVGVLSHHTGEREILVYSQEDRDQCAPVVNILPLLRDPDRHLVGGSSYPRSRRPGSVDYDDKVRVRLVVGGAGGHR